MFSGSGGGELFMCVCFGKSFLVLLSAVVVVYLFALLPVLVM